jgi:hypothetical protein
MRRAHLRNQFRDAFRKVEALRKLRIDEQTNFHDGLFSLAARTPTLRHKI